jgi:hypothetical protein
MNIDDVYRRHAAEADRQARLARNALDRAAWQRVAQGWMSLLHKRPQSDEEASRNMRLPGLGSSRARFQTIRNSSTRHAARANQTWPGCHGGNRNMKQDCIQSLSMAPHATSRWLS